MTSSTALGGTLITHADDDIHIVAVSSIQQTAARDVAAAFGATIEFLDAPYHRISDHAQRVKDALAEDPEGAPTDLRLRPAGDRRLDRRTTRRWGGPPRRGRPGRHVRLPEPRPALPDRLDDARVPPERLDRPAVDDRPAQEGRTGRDHDPRPRGRVAEGPRRVGGQPGPPLRARHRLAVAPRRRRSMPSSRCRSTACRRARTCRASRSGWAARSTRWSAAIDLSAGPSVAPAEGGA